MRSATTARCPRHNFDTLLWALVTVFQVLTGEDWNAVMYDGMAANGNSSALYFVLLLVIGNFLVLNLFIAILLTNFGQQEISEEYESTRKVLESISFFKFMSKEKKKKERSAEELEKERFWAELPDKEMTPTSMSNWECLAEAVLTRLWEEEQERRAEEDARIAAEEAARQARIDEERAVAEGRLKRQEGPARVLRRRRGARRRGVRPDAWRGPEAASRVHHEVARRVRAHQPRARVLPQGGGRQAVRVPHHELHPDFVLHDGVREPGGDGGCVDGERARGGGHRVHGDLRAGDVHEDRGVRDLLRGPGRVPAGPPGTAWTGSSW